MSAQFMQYLLTGLRWVRSMRWSRSASPSFSTPARDQLRPGRIRDDRRHGNGVADRRRIAVHAGNTRRGRGGSVGRLALGMFAVEPAQGASVVTLVIITIGASIFLRGWRCGVGQEAACAQAVHRRYAIAIAVQHPAAEFVGVGSLRHRARAVLVFSAHAAGG